MGEIKSIPQIIEEVSPYYKKKKAPEAVHNLVYDSSSETLEPVYFFILDLMNNMGMSPEKLVDNFSSTPGSGHFAELGQRATVMQQQAGKIMGDVNTVLRSVLNIVYDLKEFKIRLSHYESLNSKKKEEQEGAMLALKQIWMDKVDINKGNSSMKAMTFGQSGFQTLMDAFLVAKDEKEADKIDLNDRVKRIVKSRIIEFNIWLKESEKELKKRYELEKTYLKSQVNSLKLYSRWVRPYLKAAQELESKESNNPALVKTFNTIILELTLLGKNKLDVADEAAKGNAPIDFAKDKFLGNRRKYASYVLVSFTFRGIPQRISQQSHYAFGGRAEITFSAYSLNDDEIKKFNETMKQSEINDVLTLIEGATTESLTHLEEDINSFLDEKQEEKKLEKGMSLKDAFEPFSALFGLYNKKTQTKKDTKKESGVVAPDDWAEENYFRPLAAEQAKTNAMTLFDTYKKSHGMESFS
ncbi:hypothetical protein M0R72_04070 [Candidatus Pacearchaeota archaeon]|jgi:hypothetical protein|nr:hypothetical protein [Candidatus Pacearchaeota archaeon]